MKIADKWKRYAVEFYFGNTVDQPVQFYNELEQVAGTDDLEELFYRSDAMVWSALEDLNEQDVASMTLQMAKVLQRLSEEN